MRKIVDPTSLPLSRLEAEKLFFKEGSKEARLVVKAPQVLKLLQRVETILKAFPEATAEERRLINDLSKMLDYIELG